VSRPYHGGAVARQVKLLQRLRHKNIVAYRDSFVHDNYLCIVMAYCAGGDLQAQIKCAREAGVIFTREQVVDWTSQILEALRYLHQDKHILHRDLKSQNVFLVPERVLVRECCHALPPTSSSRGKGRAAGGGAAEAAPWQLEQGESLLSPLRARWQAGVQMLEVRSRRLKSWRGLAVNAAFSYVQATWST